MPWDHIVAYGHHVGLDADIIDTFVALIRAMDEGYLGWATEEVERTSKQKLGKDKTK